MAQKGARVKSSNYPSVVREVSYIDKIKPRTCCCMIYVSDFLQQQADGELEYMN